uniref:Uncharacterized protein n=1 Tax=Triticum urartu TaxID=4572 RepID=A0A8R7PJA4_TRIUA
RGPVEGKQLRLKPFAPIRTLSQATEYIQFLQENEHKCIWVRHQIQHLTFRFGSYFYLTPRGHQLKVVFGNEIVIWLLRYQAWDNELVKITFLCWYQYQCHQVQSH